MRAMVEMARADDGRARLRDRHGGERRRPLPIAHQAVTVAAGPDTDHDGLSDDARGRAGTTPTRANGTPTATVSCDGAEVRRYKTNPRRATPTATASPTAPRLAATAPIRAETRHRPRPPVRRRRGAALQDEPAGEGLRRRRVGRRGRDQAGHEPPQPLAAVPASPARTTPACLLELSLTPYTGPDDHHDAEHGDRREDDGLHRGAGARGGDPQLEDLVPRRRRSHVDDKDFTGTPVLIEDSADRLRERRRERRSRGALRRSAGRDHRLRERLQHQPGRRRSRTATSTTSSPRARSRTPTASSSPTATGTAAPTSAAR